MIILPLAPQFMAKMAARTRSAPHCRVRLPQRTAATHVKSGRIKIHSGAVTRRQPPLHSPDQHQGFRLVTFFQDAATSTRVAYLLRCCQSPLFALTLMLRYVTIPHVSPFPSDGRRGPIRKCTVETPSCLASRSLSIHPSTQSAMSTRHPPLPPAEIRACSACPNRPLYASIVHFHCLR